MTYDVDHITNAMFGLPGNELEALVCLIENRPPFRQPFSVEGLVARKATLRLLIETALLRQAAENRARA